LILKGALLFRPEPNLKAFAGFIVGMTREKSSRMLTDDIIAQASVERL